MPHRFECRSLRSKTCRARCRRLFASDAVLNTLRTSVVELGLTIAQFNSGAAMLPARQSSERYAFTRGLTRDEWCACGWHGMAHETT